MYQNNPVDNIISREEVKEHGSKESCWVIINGYVYDLTEFLVEHSGGEEIILENAGFDATSAFENQRCHDNRNVVKELEKYLVGKLRN